MNVGKLKERVLCRGVQGRGEKKAGVTAHVGKGTVPGVSRIIQRKRDDFRSGAKAGKKAVRTLGPSQKWGKKKNGNGKRGGVQKKKLQEKAPRFYPREGKRERYKGKMGGQLRREYGQIGGIW